MKRFALAVCLLLGAAVPAAFAVQTLPAAASPAAQAAGSRCQNTQLNVNFTSSQGAAGTIFNVYALHNLTSRPCTLYGYPGVLLMDRNFHTLPTMVHRGGGMLPRVASSTVQLAAFGKAYFTMAYSDVPVGQSPCQAPAKFLMVFAPNDLLPIVSFAGKHGSVYSCTGSIYVTPVTSSPST